MKRLLCIAVMLPFLAGAQPRKEPVPPQFLSGNTLTIRAANFSVSAPNSSWRWDRLIPSKPNPLNLGTYVCVNPATNQYYVLTVHDFKATSVSDDLVRGFLQGIRDSDPEIAKSMETSAVRVGIFDSLRFRHLKSYPNIGPQYTFGYVVATGRVLTIQTITPDAKEPEGLRPFVASLKLLRP